MKLFRPRFGLRSLLALVTVAAIIAASGPRLYRRFQSDRAVRIALQGNTQVDFWSLAPGADSPKEQAAWLAEDADRILERLLRIVESNRADAPRRNALFLLHSVVAHAHSAPLRAKSVERLASLIGHGPESCAHDELLLGVFTEWVRGVGVHQTLHDEIVAKARAQMPKLSPEMAEVLEALGSREETELLLRLGETPDRRLAVAIHGSQLTNSSWPGLLPYLRRWLAEPRLAPDALRYFVLRSTDEGREILLDYVLDSSHPAQLRKQALETLEETLAGCQLLLQTCDDPSRTALFAEILKDPPLDSFGSAQQRAAQVNGAMLWHRLVEGLESKNWLPGQGPPEMAAQFAAARQKMTTLSLRALMALSGREDLKTPKEWREWYATSEPPAISQRRLLSLIIEQPDLLNHAEMMRRVVPHALGRMPDDCLPLYLRLLHEGPDNSRYWAAHALLIYTDNLEAVPVLINFIGRGIPHQEPSVHPGEIELLKKRFAVNYFWDVGAWEAWWRHYEKE